MPEKHDHLSFCKKRALEYVERGELKEAFASMMSDLQKHESTQGHAAIELGFILEQSGHLSTKDEMRRFIEGFN